MLRRVRGGLGMATVVANAIFASITGASVASALTDGESASAWPSSPEVRCSESSGLPSPSRSGATTKPPISRIATPVQMELSATLNAGQCQVP